MLYESIVSLKKIQNDLENKSTQFNKNKNRYFKNKENICAVIASFRLNAYDYRNYQSHNDASLWTNTGMKIHSSVARRNDWQLDRGQ